MALDNVPVFEGSEWNNIELYRLLSFKGGLVVDHVLLCCHNKIIDLSFGINLLLCLFITLNFSHKDIKRAQSPFHTLTYTSVSFAIKVEMYSRRQMKDQLWKVKNSTMKVLTVTVNYSSQADCIRATVTSPVGLWTTVLRLWFFLFRTEFFWWRMWQTAQQMLFCAWMLVLVSYLS